jgi:hypothetical protein
MYCTAQLEIFALESLVCEDNLLGVEQLVIRNKQGRCLIVTPHVTSRVHGVVHRDCVLIECWMLSTPSHG